MQHGVTVHVSGGGLEQSTQHRRRTGMVRFVVRRYCRMSHGSGLSHRLTRATAQVLPEGDRSGGVWSGATPEGGR